MDRPRILALAAIPAAFIVAILLSACPYSAAWRTMDSTIKARDEAATGLAAWARSEIVRCEKVPDDIRAECLKPAHKAISDWRNVARPAINSALHAASSAVQIAEKAGTKKLDWLSILAPAVCALARVSKAWGHLWPEKATAILGLLAVAEVTCE